METRDYNGPDEWSLEGVRRRYRMIAKELGVPVASELTPLEHQEGDVRWVYPVMDAVIKGIEGGDAACIELGVAFIESGHRQPFGRILHSNTARALRRTALTPSQSDRLRTRILAMLVAGQVPHEFKQYAKLVRHVGLGTSWERAKTQIDQANPYVLRYVRYFEACAREESARR
jgi:hypothetical protein